MKTITLSIDGMMCQHCVAHVTKALSAIEGVTPVVNLKRKTRFAPWRAMCRQKP